MKLELFLLTLNVSAFLYFSCPTPFTLLLKVIFIKSFQLFEVHPILTFSRTFFFFEHTAMAFVAWKYKYAICKEELMEFCVLTFVNFVLFKN